MVQKYVSVVLKVCSLGLMVAAGSFWAGAGVSSRPKKKDEQTLIGGTVWSQIIIPIGLLITKTMGEELHRFIHGYFLFTGVILLFITGIFLVTREIVVLAKHRRADIENIELNNKKLTREIKFDKLYFFIGIFCLITGCLTLVDFIMLLVNY